MDCLCIEWLHSIGGDTRRAYVLKKGYPLKSLTRVPTLVGVTTGSGSSQLVGTLIGGDGNVSLALSYRPTDVIIIRVSYHVSPLQLSLTFYHTVNQLLDQSGGSDRR